MSRYRLDKKTIKILEELFHSVTGKKWNYSLASGGIVYKSEPRRITIFFYDGVEDDSTQLALNTDEIELEQIKLGNISVEKLNYDLNK